MNKPKNPSAFPCLWDCSHDPDMVLDEGMSLRDWFAGKSIKTAFDNLVRKCVWYADEEYQKNHVIPANEIAKEAYIIANAMLKEREKL